MAIAICSCGARYRVADSAAGKRGRCRKCGSEFIVPPAAPADDFPELETPAPPTAAERPPTPTRVAAPGAPPAALAGRSAQSAEDAPAGAAGWPYLLGVGRSMQALFTTGNLVTLAIMWVLLGLRAVGVFAPCVGPIAGILITGWYLAFLFNTVVESAANEDDLPNIALTAGIVDEVFVPLLKYALVAILQFAPALAYLAVLVAVGGADAPTRAQEALALLTGSGGRSMIGADADTIRLLALVAAGLFFSPMLMLCAAVGGIGSLGRVDLMFRTIVRTLPGYVLTVLIVYATFAARIAVSAALMRPQKIGDFGPAAAVGAAELLGSVVAMRAIGLYYHYFKHRFAWSWG